MGKKKPSCLSCFGSNKEREISYCKNIEIRIHVYGTQSGPILKREHAFLVDNKVITFEQRKNKNPGDSNFLVTISDRKDLVKWDESSIKVIGKSSESVKMIAKKLSSQCSGNEFDLSGIFYLVTGTDVQLLVKTFKSESQYFPSDTGQQESGTSILQNVTITNILGGNKQPEYSKMHGIDQGNGASEMFTIEDQSESIIGDKAMAEQKLIDKTSNTELQ